MRVDSGLPRAFSHLNASELITSVFMQKRCRGVESIGLCSVGRVIIAEVDWLSQSTQGRLQVLEEAC